MKLSLMALVILAQLRAQPIPDSPAFEVASIKPCVLSKRGDGPGPIGITISGNRVAAVIALRYLITYAYEVKDYQIEGAEKWMPESPQDAYCISAKTDGEIAAPPDQVRLMFQALLADRFALRLHRETRVLPIYALVLDTKGAKLKTSPLGAVFSSRRVRAKDGVSVQLTASRHTMSQLAVMLSRGMDRPVLDSTGLTGGYDFTLEWADRSNPRAPDMGTSIFTAVQEQLGLKLDPQRAELEILVVDQARKIPLEN